MSTMISPAFEDCKNCIVFSSNEGFAPATAVAIRSLIESGDKNARYDILLLNTDIKKPTADKLLSLVGEYDNVSLRLIDVKSIARGRRFYTKNRDTLTKEAYYRLFVPYILDEAYEYALYFDADMIFYRDVNELFGIDMEGALIAAVRDYWGICNCYMPDDDRRSYREGIGLKDIDEYVISATILFDLAAFREAHSFDEVLKLIGKKKWFQHDQDVINVLCTGRIKHIMPEWGMLTDYGNNHYLPQKLQDELYGSKDNVAIFHFAAYRKPWRGQYGEDHMNFWKHAARTPFFDALLGYVTTKEQLNYIIYYLKKEPEFADLDWEIKETFEKTDEDRPEGRYFHNIYLGPYGGGHARYRIIREEKGMLHLEGMLGFFGVPEGCYIKTTLRINGKYFQASSQKDEDGYSQSYDVTTYRGVSFVFDIPIGEIEDMIYDSHKAEVYIVCDVNGRRVVKNNLGFERFSPIVRNLNFSYAPLKRLLVYTDREKIVFYNNTFLRRFLYERRLILSNCFVSRAPYLRAILIRKIAHIKRAFKKKPVWIITDRVMKADDNGEALFTYLCERDDADKRDVYFVLDKESPDYERISKIGKVVEPSSSEHKLLLTTADCVVSSQTDMIFRYPFLWNGRLYRDMLANINYVFLQHGVLEKDASSWLKRSTQEMRGMVTSAPKERDMILNGNYDYGEDEIWLTGLARFDKLTSDPEKIITVLPTWRKYLSTGQDKRTGVWGVVANFESSDYVTFYRDLVNDKRLKDALKQYGYTLKFKIHPSFATHEDKFGFDDLDIWWDEAAGYKDIYKKSSLIITDYSSSINDFIYLYKPIMYCQFDFDDFYGGTHITQRGDFDYESEGFGEVSKDVASTVDNIISYMKDDCRLKDTYKKRIDDFFAYHDRNNCERIFKKICELNEE